MNWISPTGLSPCAAIPTQSPLIRVSDSGVSKTRSTPKRCCKPAVARKTPHGMVVEGDALIGCDGKIVGGNDRSARGQADIEVVDHDWQQDFLRLPDMF